MLTCTSHHDNFLLAYEPHNLRSIAHIPMTDIDICSLVSPCPHKLFSALNLQSHPLPVCIDLDFTLLRSSSLYFFFPRIFGGVGRFLLQHPWRWSQFKAWAARTYPIEASRLPYRSFLVDFLHLCKARGIPLVLATGAALETAHAVADYLGCFDHVISSTPNLHCVGKHKAQALVQHFGAKKFYYFGDSRQDFPVWQQACGVLALNPSLQLTRALQDQGVGKPYFFLYDT